MPDLSDFQWELDGVTWGIYADSGITVEDGGFDPGTKSRRTQDGVLPNRPGNTFGRDFIDGTTWAWTLSTDFEDEASAVDAIERIQGVWEDEKYEQVGVVSPLRYQRLGRTRRVYGRPQNFSAPPSNRILSGYAPIVCDFKTVDKLVYDDTEQQVIISLTALGDGGWRFPCRFPVTPLPFVNRDGKGFSAGTTSSWPIIRINGPILNPTLEGPGWTLSLQTSLGVDDYIEIDTRPWVQTVLKNGSQNAAGLLGRRQLMRNMRIPPGAVQFTMYGNAGDSGAGATITWRDAYKAL